MSTVQFTPLLDLGRDGATANILQIDTTIVLLDCGWTPALDPALLQPVLRILPKVSYILVSQPALEHLGALPYLAKQPGYRAAVYATLPVARMGQMVLFDAYLSRAKYERFSALSVKDINSVFESVVQLKYSEKFLLKEVGVVVTPTRAGHTVGGTAWKLTYDMQDIIYAPCVFPHPQRHISGLDFHICEQALLLILGTTACNDRPRAEEERRFLEAIRDTIGREGSVLVPVQAAGPTLEMLVALEEFWDRNRDDLQSAGLYFLGNMTRTTIDFIKSHLEWMNERAISQFEFSRDNLFTFKYVKLVQSEEEIDWSQPCCILATPWDCSSPLSRSVLARMAERENNLLLVSELPSPGFLQTLIDAPKGTFFEFPATRLVLPSLDITDSTSALDESQPETVEAGDQQPSTDPADNVAKHFETKAFPCFAICECKTLADEYGEEMTEAELLLWRNPDEMEEVKERRTEQEMRRQLQTPVFQMMEEERVRKNASLEECTVSFHLLLRKAVCLFDSRPDLVSMKLTIAKARPKQLALLGSCNRPELAEYAKTQASVREVHLPEPGAVLNLLQHFTIRPIHFSEELYRSLQFHSVDGYEVSYIKGEVQDTEDRLLFHIRQEETPSQEHGVFLGTLSLNQLKANLVERGYRVLFREGKLVVNESVLLSRTKDERGRTHYQLEGLASKEYYDLRRVLYSHFVYL